MNTFIKSIRNGAVNFARDEEGAQIVEYALIIAAVSLALIVAMSTGANSIATSFGTWLLTVKTCLTGGAC